MSPDISFGTFESWGGRERVRNNNECVYYFFIDNWGDEPRLRLMERAIKHAEIIADIEAPLKIIKRCIKEQGCSSSFEKNYAINDHIKQWLMDNVLDNNNSGLVTPRIAEANQQEDMGPPLRHIDKQQFTLEVVSLPTEPSFINDNQIAEHIKKWGFYDSKLNPSGRFANSFAAAGDHPEVVIDQRTSLMWQRFGIDIGSIRMVQRKMKELNNGSFAGFSDWRLPSIEEAMSLMEPVKNSKDIFLHPCFSKKQPFIFVVAQRRPGGYWFVDFKQGRAFWSSGTIPGGFGRLVRSLPS